LTIYQPIGPYRIKSGKRKGKVLELLMFNDYSFLLWMFQKLERVSKGGKNELHLHLEWLIKKGETRQPKITCPQCGKRPVRYFSVVYERGGDFSIGPYYTCCEDPKCIYELRAQALDKSPQFLPFYFSVIKNFQLKFDQKRIANLFLEVFELPKPLTRKIAFKFFRD